MIKIKKLYFKFKMMKKYNKLVRDKVPEILAKNKITCKTHVAGRKEYLAKLYKKLNEEIKEFKNKPSINEFIDIVEVVETIGNFYRYEPEQIALRKSIKKFNNGGFDKKIILEETE